MYVFFFISLGQQYEYHERQKVDGELFEFESSDSGSHNRPPWRRGGHAAIAPLHTSKRQLQRFGFKPLNIP